MEKKVLASVVLVLVLGLSQTGLAADFDPSTDPDVIGWWRCEEGAGSVVADSSPNGNDGTFVNGDPAWTIGFRGSGSAIRLEGPTLVEVPAMDLTLTEATMAGWLLPNGPQSDWASIIMHRGSGSAHGFNLLADRRLAYHWNDGEPSWGYRGDAYYAADEWTHCAVTVEPDKATFYVNGVAASTNAIAHTASTWDNPIHLGGDDPSSWAGRQMDGSLDEVLFVSRALTAEEIKSLVPPQLKAWSPDPADGSTGIAVPLFKWNSGDTALFHKVYFGTTPDLTEADVKSPQQPFNLYYHMLPLEPGTTYYWRIDEIEVDGTVHIGDVWSASTTPLISHLPQPADGDGAVSPEATLSWTGGMDALTYHLYLGEDLDAVTLGTADVDMGILEESAFDPNGLKGGTTYYWRADGIGFGDVVTTGEVWTFSTFFLVDNFEGYDDDMDAGTAVFQTWADGIDNGTGSIVGHLESQNGTFNETTIVHGGGQAMLLDFDNSNTPWYSESQRTWATSQDWTINGLSNLVLHVYGYPVPVEYTVDAGVYTITGEGTDIWGTADEFTYLHKQLNGNGSLVARVVSNGTGSNTWAKGGVMIRESLDAGSTHGFMPITGGGGNGASFQYRPIVDSDSLNTDVDAANPVEPPYWVKIERTGSSLTSSISPDGTAWTQLGTPQFIVMNDPIYIGLAVTSHAAGEYRTFEFDNVQQSGGVSGGWQLTEIGLTRNAGVPLYVALEDSTGKIGVVSDPEMVNVADWTEWSIALADFGVDASRIRAMYLGAGDRDNPVPGGSGRIFIDDIRVTKPAPAAEEPVEVVIE